MPTERSLRNLAISPEVRRENVRKMVATKRAATLARYREIYDKYVRLTEIHEDPLMTFDRAAGLLKMNRDTLARAVRVVRGGEK